MKILYDNRPWGKEEILAINEKCTVKILSVDPGQRLSLQYHNHRREFWKLIEGDAILQMNDKIIEAKSGEEYFIEPKMIHRITGKDKPAKVLEISFGDFDENDIVRIEDDYGRMK